MRRRSLFGLWPLALSFPARAQAGTVDLQLVLAVDASGSVNQERFELQKQGYVAAFRNPEVHAAIRTGASQAIAVAMVQWTGPTMQVLVVDWMRIGDAAESERFAAAVERVPRRLFWGGTSISALIDYAVKLFDRSPLHGARRVIDISGDGQNNSGRPSGEARDDAVEAGITINGLPILNVEDDLDVSYRDDVIGGPGSFMIAIDNYDQFAGAIQRKLITEIAASGLPRVTVARGGPAD